MAVQNCVEHPRPWRKMAVQSGIAIKDTNGATVLFIPFTGAASRNRKAEVAELVLAAVNGGLPGV